jgi:hypothetical protein
LKVQLEQACVKKRTMAGGPALLKAGVTVDDPRVEDENDLSGQLDDGPGALAKARLAPAVKDAVNQMISHRLALGHQLMALLTFPLAARAAFRLFEYHCH